MMTIGSWITSTGRRGLTGILAALLVVVPFLPAARADCLCGTAADEFTVAEVGLTREWILQVPFDAATARVESVVVARDLVVVQTGDGNVHAVRSTDGGPDEPRAGTLLWTRHLGGLGPIIPAGVGPTSVVVTRDKELAAFDARSGGLLWHEHVARPAHAGPAVSGAWVYVPLPGDHVRRLPLNPHRAAAAAPVAEPDPKKKSAKGRAKAGKKQERRPTESLEPVSLDGGGRVDQQPQPFAGGALWCTTEGRIVALIPTDDGWQRHEFLLDRPPAGRLMVRENAIFAATKEGDLARIDLVREPRPQLKLAWSLLLEATPDGDLFVTDDRLIVPLGEEGIAAYGAKTGEHLWSTWFPGRIVAVTAARVWIIDHVGRLTGLDAADGTRRERLCLGGFSLPVVNQMTDRLVLATPTGVIVSLEPTK